MNREKQKSPFTGSGPARIQEMLRRKGESECLGGTRAWQVVASEDLCLNTKWLVFVFMFVAVAIIAGLIGTNFGLPPVAPCFRWGHLFPRCQHKCKN